MVQEFHCFYSTTFPASLQQVVTVESVRTPNSSRASIDWTSHQGLSSVSGRAHC